MQALLHTILLRSPVNLFDEFTRECQKWYEEPAHTFTEMRTRDNKKIRGDIFEDFSVLYLKHVKGYTNVWRLEDVPEHVLGGLGLKRPDMGIDIIAEKGGKYTAVQCKYKKHNTIKKNVLSWKSLSTFYALCLRTGPWEKYIVITNCEYARHAGKKTPKDLSVCLKTLQNITKEEWTRMCEIEGHTTQESTAPKLNLDQLRAARLARFGTGDSTPHTS
jgi:predicted helicase